MGLNKNLRYLIVSGSNQELFGQKQVTTKPSKPMMLI